MTLRPACLALAALLGTASALAQGSLEPKTFRLGNGMTFLLFDQPEAVTVQAGWAVGVGSGDDPPGLSGMAHLVEHMMFKGTEAVGPGELDRLYTRAGASTPNAFTTADTTVYLVSLPAEKLELWFWLESDRLLHPVFRGLEAEVGVIRQEQGQALGNPTAALDEAIDAAFFPGLPYRRSRFGAPGELEAVRDEDLAHFVAERYTADRLTAVLYGPLDEARVRSLAERYFGRLPRRPVGGPGREPSAAGLDGGSASAPEVGLGAERRLVLPAAGPPRWVARWPTVPSGHPDEAALDLLVALLNGRSGRLQTALVSSGLAARASADLQSLRRGGWLSIRLEARPGIEASRLEGAVAGVLQRLANEEIPASELDRARSMSAADALRRLANPPFLVGRLLHAAATRGSDGDWRRPLDQPERVLAVSAADLRRVAGTLFLPERRLVAEVGLAQDRSLEPRTSGRAVLLRSSFPRKRESIFSGTGPSPPRSPFLRLRSGQAPGPPTPALRERGRPEGMDSRLRGNDQQEGPRKRHGGSPPPAAVPSRPEGLLLAPFEPRLPDPRAHRRVLASGVALYLAEDRTLPLAEVTFQLRVGDFLEPLGETGLAALTARSWRRGGTVRLAPPAFEEALERLGGRLQVSPGLAHTSVSLSVLTANLPGALDLLFELLQRPGFEAGALAQEQRASLDAMKRRNDDGAVLGPRTWDRLVYGPDHFAARLPTAAEMVKHDHAAVAAFHRRWWGPRNLVVAVSGALEAEAVIARLELGLAGWGSEAEEVPWPPAAPVGAGPGWRWLDRPGPQSWAALGGPGLAWAGRWDDPQLYAAGLAHEILVGAGFSSRLVGRLREAEGLVYFPASEVGLGPVWSMPWQIRFQTRPDQLERAIAIVREELARLVAEPISAAELELAQTSLLSRLARGFESRRERVTAFALDELQGRPLDFWPRAAERYTAVTPEQVRQAARRLYAEPAWVLEVGPEGTFRSAAEAAGVEVEELPLLEPMTLKPGG